MLEYSCFIPSGQAVQWSKQSSAYPVVVQLNISWPFLFVFSFFTLG